MRVLFLSDFFEIYYKYMNVTEIARRVKIPTQRLREIIPELGYDIGMRAIKVDDRQAHEIIQKLSNTKIREKFLSISKEEEKKEDDNKKVVMKEGVVQIPDNITVKDLALQLHISTTQLILVLMRNGVMAAQNENIDFETASIVAEDFGFEVQKVHLDLASDENEARGHEKLLYEDGGDLRPRPPVVVIMGHVDHGKTKLLDVIRRTNVVGEEHGGITQHIGAYQVEKRGRMITFIDTPGHEAFTAMRSRGARVADVAILVIAADDGVQPQTIEALSHIQRVGLPFIVAINKIDKEGADPNKVKQGLADARVMVEDWGGDIPSVEISALKGEGIDELLDVVLLVADLHKDTITADPFMSAVGTIIESHVDKGEGPVATVLIQKGTLRLGDAVQVGGVFGKVKAMRDYRGGDIKEAFPSTPAKLLGLKSVPRVGDILFVPEDVKLARRALKKERHVKGVPEVARRRLVQQEVAETEGAVNVVLKADVLGSLEAILEALEPVQNQSGGMLKIVSKGLGPISEADAAIAADQGANLIGFNVSVLPGAKEFSRNKNVSIHNFSVIYDLVDFVVQEVERVLPVDKIRSDLGEVKILKIFKVEKNSSVVGGFVLNGMITSDAKLDVKRNGEIAGHASISELQSGKQQVKEVVEGQECGIRLDGFSDCQIGDVLVVYTEEEKARKINV